MAYDFGFGKVKSASLYDPYITSGAFAQVAQSDYNTKTGLRRNKYEVDKYLMDLGINRDAKVTSMQDDPYTAYNQATTAATNKSTNSGFGTSGRMFGLNAAQPRYQMKKSAVDAINDEALSSTEQVGQQAVTNSNAFVNSAVFGVNNKQFRVPKARRVRGY